MSHISAERSQTITLSRAGHPELGPQNREPSFPAFVRVILIMPTCFSSLSLSLPQLSRISRPFTLQFHLDKLFTSLRFLNTSVSATRADGHAVMFYRITVVADTRVAFRRWQFPLLQRNPVSVHWRMFCSIMFCSPLFVFFPCFFMTSDTFLMYFLPCCRWKTPLYFNYSLVVIYCE